MSRGRGGSKAKAAGTSHLDNLGAASDWLGQGLSWVCPGAPTPIPPTLWLEASGGSVASEEDPGQSLGLW